MEDTKKAEWLIKAGKFMCCLLVAFSVGLAQPVSTFSVWIKLIFILLGLFGWVFGWVFYERFIRKQVRLEEIIKNKKEAENNG